MTHEDQVTTTAECCQGESMPEVTAQDARDTIAWAKANGEFGALIFHGDCLDSPVPPNPALVYADPPFGSGVTRSGKAGGYDDTLTGPAYVEWLTTRLERFAASIQNGWLCLHHDPVLSFVVAASLRPTLGDPFGVVAWQDAWVSGFRSRAASFWPRVHDTLTFWRIGDPPFHPTIEDAPEGYKRRGGGGGKTRPLGDLWVGPWSPSHLSFSTEKVGWPDQKPVALLDRIVRATTNEGDLVVDPFCGSGTTLVAARASGRRAYGCEPNEAAYDLATARLKAVDAIESAVRTAEADFKEAVDD